MSQAKNLNSKIRLCLLGLVLFLLAMFGIKSLLIQSDLENKREIDELIRKQQALIKVKSDSAAEATSTAQAVTTGQ